MNKLIYILLLLVGFGGAHAQGLPDFSGGGGDKIYDGKITGTVIDSLTNKPVGFANIGLYKAGSKKPIDGTVTDDKGFFKLKNIKNGKYKVSVSFLGYTTIDFDSVDINDKKTSIELGKIIIKPSSKMLKEAVVEAEKPLIDVQIDKIVYNAEKDLTSKGGNAADVLRKVPMVTVDLDDNVTLQGTQNIKVLINNKPSSIMAASVPDALKMIPADEIEKVEVITSPSAKYDAEGTGGIINIITKKKNMQGLSGSVNAGVGTRSSHMFGSVNYRAGRFGTGLNVGGFGFYSNGDLTTNRYTYNDYVSGTVRQDGTTKNLGAGPFIQWTGDYDINSKNNLSTSIRFRDFYRSTKGVTDNSLSPDQTNFTDYYTSDYKNITKGINVDANLDYKRTFKKPDQELSGSVQMTNNQSNTSYEVAKNYTAFPDSNETSENKSNNREITFQGDYVHPFSKVFTLETGAKNIIRDVTSDYTYHPQIVRNNSFKYDQTIYAGYLLSSISLKKFGLKTGLRYEKTDVEGKTNVDSVPFTSNYENWIPSVTLSYRKPGAHSFKISYTQRIQRPSMQYLNPYVNKSDEYNISYGNPNLDAEKSHAFELGYSLFKPFGSINTSLYYRFTDNAIESVRYVDSQGRYFSTYANVGKNYSEGISIGANILSGQKLILSFNTNVYYYKVESTDTSFDATNDGVNYSLNLFCSYKFTEKWGVQAFGNFNGPKYTIQGKSTSFFYYNCSVRREFSNSKGGIGLGLDNFATPYIHFKSNYSGTGFDYNSDAKIFFLGIRVSFDYRFGKMDFKGPKKKGIKNDDLKEGEDNQQMGMPGGNK